MVTITDSQFEERVAFCQRMLKERWRRVGCPCQEAGHECVALEGPAMFGVLGRDSWAGKPAGVEYWCNGANHQTPGEWLVDKQNKLARGELGEEEVAGLKWLVRNTNIRDPLEPHVPGSGNWD